MSIVQQGRLTTLERGSDQAAGGQPQNLVKPRMMRIIWFCYAILGICFASLIALFSGYKDINFQTGIWSGAWSMSSILTTFCTFILIKFALCLLNSEPLSRDYYAALICLTLLAGIALMVATVMALAVLDRGNAVLGGILIPWVIFIVIIACSGFGAYDENHTEIFEEEIKSGAELAVFATGTSFGMLIAMIIGYLKNPVIRGHDHPQIDLSMAFFSCTLGVFSLTVTSMPLGFRSPAKAERLVAIVKHLKTFMMVSLAAMALILAAEFLRGVIILSILPELMVGAIYAYAEFCGDDSRTPAEDNEYPRNELKPIYVGVATTSFTLLATVYAVYMENEYSDYLKASVFILLAAIMSGLRRMVFVFKPSTSRVHEQIMKMVTLLFPGLEMIIALPLAFHIFKDVYKRML